MAKYRKRPITIDAMEWTGTNLEEITAFMQSSRRKVTLQIRESKPCIEIETLEGIMTANIGDYIIKGVKGEFYPCKPDIFKFTYEKVEGVEEYEN